MAAHNSPRMVGPSLSGSAHLNDNAYGVYALSYGDYLARVALVKTPRTYVTPPHFPQSKTVSNISIQLHRRLFAMYSDTVTDCVADATVPGYCYMSILNPAGADAIAKALGPFPHLSAVLAHVDSRDQVQNHYLILQSDGTYHVVNTALGLSMRDAYDAYNGLSPPEHHFDFDSRVGGVDLDILTYYSHRASASALLPIVHAIKPYIGITWTTPLTLKLSDKRIIPDGLEVSGRWSKLVHLPEGSVLVLTPGKYIKYHGTTVGSDTTTVYFRSEYMSAVTLLSDVVVSSGAMRAHLGNAAWSSDLPQRFASSRLDISVNLFKDKATLQDFLTNPAMLAFMRTASFAMSGMVPSPMAESLVSKVPITDPLDYDAPLHDVRYEAKFRGDFLFKGSASSYRVRMLHSLRAQYMYGDDDDRYAISGFVASLHPDMRIACLTDYSIQHHVVGRDCEVSFHLVVEGDPEAFDDIYHPDGSGVVPYQTDSDS